MRGFVRIYVLLCRLSIFVLLFPFAAGAYGGGSGSPEDPYVIASPEDLHTLAISVNSGASDASAHFVQSGDIDLNARRQPPTGNEKNPFRGSYDGRGFVIRNFSIEEKRASRVGLFGCAEGAVIRNVVLEASSVWSALELAAAGMDSKTRLCVGALVGEARSSTIFNCTNSGDVRGGLAGNNTMTYTGGLVGYAVGPATRIIACRNGGAVTGGAAVCGNAGVQSATSVGGIVGGFGFEEATESALLSNCINEAEVSGGSVSGGQTNKNRVYAYAGGIVGCASAAIDSCGNAGRVTGGVSSGGTRAYVGGIVGCLKSASLANSWSCAFVRRDAAAGAWFIGGLVGLMEKSTISGRCYFGEYDGLQGVADGLVDQGGLSALPDEAFRKPETFASWESDDVGSAWFCEEGFLPKLKSLHVEPVPCTFVFSADSACGISFDLVPGYEGFSVCSIDYGDGFSIVPAAPFGGVVRFDGGSFEGEKEIAMLYAIHGVVASAGMTVRAASAPPTPAPNPDPVPNPNPEPTPDPGSGPGPWPQPEPTPPDLPFPPKPDPQPKPGVSVPVQPESIYAGEGFVRIVFPIRGSMQGAVITELRVDYPAGWDEHLTAVFEDGALLVSGSPHLSGVYILEVDGRVDGVPFKIAVTVTVLPEREVAAGDTGSEDVAPFGHGGCNVNRGFFVLFPAICGLCGRKKTS